MESCSRPLLRSLTQVDYVALVPKSVLKPVPKSVPSLQVGPQSVLKLVPTGPLR